MNEAFLSLVEGQPEDPSWRFVRAKTAFSRSGKAAIVFYCFFRLPLCWLPLLYLLSPTALAFTVRQCVAAGCAVIDSCQPHSWTAAANWPQKKSLPKVSLHQYCMDGHIALHQFWKHWRGCCNWLGGSALLADVCSASWLCSATLTAAIH